MFDEAVARRIYNELVANADAYRDTPDLAELALCASDLILAALDLIPKLNNRIAHLENECRKVGTF